MKIWKTSHVVLIKDLYCIQLEGGGWKNEFIRQKV